MKIIEPSIQEVAEALLDLLESDFERSGREERIEAIRVELETAYQRGREDEANDRLCVTEAVKLVEDHEV